jgi:hypothetical protein
MDLMTFSIHSLNYALVMQNDVSVKASLKTIHYEALSGIVLAPIVANGVKS